MIVKPEAVLPTQGGQGDEVSEKKFGPVYHRSPENLGPFVFGELGRVRCSEWICNGIAVCYVEEVLDPTDEEEYDAAEDE